MRLDSCARAFALMSVGPVGQETHDPYVLRTCSRPSWGGLGWSAASVGGILSLGLVGRLDGSGVAALAARGPLTGLEIVRIERG